MVALNPQEVNRGRPAALTTFNNEKKWTIKPVEPFLFKQPIPQTFYGTVESKLESEGEVARYRVAVYFLGLSDAPKIVTVKVPQLSEESELPPNYPLMVSRVVWITENDRVPTVEFVSQPPIWYPKPEDTP